jgi:hypothetical protein
MLDPIDMTSIVRELLAQGPGEALCDACLALACSVSLLEARSQATRLAESHPAFVRGESTPCSSCCRPTAVTVFVPSAE